MAIRCHPQPWKTAGALNMRQIIDISIVLPGLTWSLEPPHGFSMGSSLELRREKGLNARIALNWVIQWIKRIFENFPNSNPHWSLNCPFLWKRHYHGSGPFWSYLLKKFWSWNMMIIVLEAQFRDSESEEMTKASHEEGVIPREGNFGASFGCPDLIPLKDSAPSSQTEADFNVILSYPLSCCLSSSQVIL